MVETAQLSWMKYFKGTGCEAEHEAFLAFWLSAFVVPDAHYGSVKKIRFPTCNLSCQRDFDCTGPGCVGYDLQEMSLLKDKMDEFSKARRNGAVVTLELKAPFYLVKLWVWVRFPKLRPHPNRIMNGAPRSAMWFNLKKLENVDVRLAIETGGQCLQWKPYAATVGGWSFNRFYRDEDQWLTLVPDFDEEMESFARCLRISELVGADNCIQPYLPHRVAMPFGFDQDIPDNVVRHNGTFESAWGSYSKSIRDANYMHRPNYLNPVQLLNTLNGGGHQIRLKDSESGDILQKWRRVPKYLKLQGTLQLQFTGKGKGKVSPVGFVWTVVMDRRNAGVRRHSDDSEDESENARTRVEEICTSMRPNEEVLLEEVTMTNQENDMEDAQANESRNEETGNATQLQVSNSDDKIENARTGVAEIFSSTRPNEKVPPEEVTRRNQENDMEDAQVNYVVTEVPELKELEAKIKNMGELISKSEAIFSAKLKKKIVGQGQPNL